MTAGDRLRATVLFSVLVHGLVLLGVGFTVDDAAPITPTLEVILTQTRSDKAPEQADFLAATSQQGGGDKETRERPRAPTSAAVPKPTEGVTPTPQKEGAPKPVFAPTQSVVSAAALEADASNDPRTEHQDIPLPTSQQLIERSMEMARLAAELERQAQAYAKRPKRKFVSANTKEYEFATYMRAWVARVEKIGNMNYPAEARARNLQGQLVLTVAVRRDGTVESIDVIQPSGYPVLDDAAVRTVRLAEPFAPIPQTKEQIDVLHITRTWQFLPGGIMRNR
ncbi:MAG: energy transducer TonB [Xanthomonadales bacterium]|nr:energy transducer TonB [Xanthomonadales bacterium]